MKIELFSSNKRLQTTIIRTSSDPNTDKLRYRIVTPLSQEGYVYVALRDLSWFRERGEPLAEVLNERVYEDVVAEITHFFPYQVPHSSEVPRDFSRKGLGTSVLRKVVHDLSSSLDIAHFYVKNPSVAFYNLLLCQRFRELKITEDPVNEHLYRRTRR